MENNSDTQKISLILLKILIWAFGAACSTIMFITGVTPYILVNQDDYISKNSINQDYVKKKKYDNLKTEITKLKIQIKKEKEANTTESLVPQQTNESIPTKKEKVDFEKMAVIDKNIKDFYDKYPNQDFAWETLYAEKKKKNKRRMARLEFNRIVALIREANLQNHYAEFIMDVDSFTFKKMKDNNEIDD
ncbi:MAG: hypothetical protein GY765_32315 [bacterium]|nr:hypothetical protein [bacterium]